MNEAWGATRIKFDPGPPLTLMRPSGALGQAGDGGDQDRAEHKAHDADRGKDKTLPSGQAVRVRDRRRTR
jgi:hypothetical protein